MTIANRSKALGVVLLLGAVGLAGVGCQSATNVLKSPNNQPMPHMAHHSARPETFDPLGMANEPSRCQCETGTRLEQVDYRNPSRTGTEEYGAEESQSQQRMVRGASEGVYVAADQPNDPRELPNDVGDPNKEADKNRQFNCPIPPPPPPEIAAHIPTELQKVTLPAYVIEPPDILFIDAVRLVPKPPYRLQPLDSVILAVTETFPDQPIAGTYIVAPEGTISLGFTYGSVRVVGLTVEEITKVLQEHLGKILKNPQVAVSLGQIRAVQQTRGEHLVHPDGTVHLGVYGCVNVTGMTLAQAKCAIERHLEEFLQDPEVTVDILAYNSKSFYVITDGAGYGQPLYKFPITGNDTVLDALERIGGLPTTTYRGRIWVARPSPCGHGCNQILPVDWQAIVQGGSTCTNYQLFPGDRVYVRADPLIRVDNALAKMFAPVERILGITLLFQSVIRSFSGSGSGNGGVGFITGF